MYRQQDAMKNIVTQHSLIAIEQQAVGPMIEMQFYLLF
jgi:hypothetical protein